MVREQLQDEFLRLQAELGKTIVFVTHDIDEAIKLGDQVAGGPGCNDESTHRVEGV